MILYLNPFWCSGRNLQKVHRLKDRTPRKPSVLCTTHQGAKRVCAVEQHQVTCPYSVGRVSTTLLALTNVAISSPPAGVSSHVSTEKGLRCSLVVAEL